MSNSIRVRPAICRPPEQDVATELSEDPSSVVESIPQDRSCHGGERSAGELVNMAEPSFHLRRGEKSDAPALAEFATRIFSDTFGADNKPEDMAAHLADRFGVRQQTE